MSNVTNLILTTRFVDRDNAESLNTRFRFRGEIGLVSCDDETIGSRWYGGDGRLSMNVMIGACGEVDLAKLVLTLRQVPWAAKASVQLFVCAADDACFVEVDWQRTTERPAADRVVS